MRGQQLSGNCIEPRKAEGEESQNRPFSHIPKESPRKSFLHYPWANTVKSHVNAPW